MVQSLPDLGSHQNETCNKFENSAQIIIAGVGHHDPFALAHLVVATLHRFACNTRCNLNLYGYFFSSDNLSMLAVSLNSYAIYVQYGFWICFE